MAAGFSLTLPRFRSPDKVEPEIAVTAAKIADSKAQMSQEAEKVLKLPRFRAPRANLPDAL
jgi:hypothetical protein